MTAATVIIPARLGSTRFPGKVLADRTGKPLIQHVYERACLARCASRVVIATDDDRVRTAVLNFGGECVMTSPEHPNGTSRLAEAARTLGLGPSELVINAQGDEPELEPQLTDAAADLMQTSGAPMGTAAVPFSREEDITNPALVKVVLAGDGSAMYFSRSVIPHRRDTSNAAGVPPLKHIGLYVYRRSFLDTYLRLPVTRLETTEQLEQLRVLYHGHRISVAVLNIRTHGGVDTPEQYDAFVARWRASNNA